MIAIFRSVAETGPPILRLLQNCQALHVEHSRQQVADFGELILRSLYGKRVAEYFR